MIGNWVQAHVNQVRSVILRHDILTKISRVIKVHRQAGSPAHHPATRDAHASLQRRHPGSSSYIAILFFQPSTPQLVQLSAIRALRLIISTKDHFCARYIAKHGRRASRPIYPPLFCSALTTRALTSLWQSCSAL